MGIMNMFMSYGKARMLGRLFGGRLGGVMMAAFLGKKAYDYMRARRTARVY